MEIYLLHVLHLRPGQLADFLRSTSRKLAPFSRAPSRYAPSKLRHAEVRAGSTSSTLAGRSLGRELAGELRERMGRMGGGSLLVQPELPLGEAPGDA